MDRTPAYLTRNARRLRRDSTEAENRLWYFLRAKRMNGIKFKRQQAVGPYIADFCSFHPALVIEVDGGQHAAAEEADQDRARFLRSRGFVVLRFWNNEVLGNTEAVVQRIAQEVRELLDSPLPSPLPEGEGNVVVQRIAQEVRELLDSPLPNPLPEGEGNVVVQRIGQEVRELLDSPLPSPLPEGEGTGDPEGDGSVGDPAATYRSALSHHPWP